MSPTAHREAGTGRLWPVERILLAYVVLTSTLAVLRLSRQPAMGSVLLANGLVVLLVIGIARAPAGRVSLALRILYPLLILTGLYGAIDFLNGFGTVAVHDAAVQRWEEALFGMQVSRVWWQAMPSRFWSTVLHGAYFAYYPIVIGPVTWFLFRGNSRAARQAVLWLIATFITCYLGFLFFPVAGPYYEFPRPAAEFLDNPMARLVYATLAKGSSYGAAFPSSHVAAALAATAAAWSGSRRLGWILLVPSALLAIGVVYCQMHYAIDAIAGAGVGAAVVAACRFAERKSEE